MPKKSTYIAHSKIVISDDISQSKEIALEAREELEFSDTQWWEMLPILRLFGEQEEWHPTKVEIDSAYIQQWFFDQGWRSVSVEAVVKPFSGKPFIRPPINKEGILVEYNVELGERWELDSVRVQGIDFMPLKLNSIPNNTVYWTLETQNKISTEIRQKMGQIGYADIEVFWHAINLEEHKIQLICVVSLNPKYKFGILEYEDMSHIQPQRIERQFPENYLLGQQYNINQINRIIHRLQEMPYYESIEVSPRINRDSHEVDLLIRVWPADSWNVKPVIKAATEATTYALSGGLTWEHNLAKVKGMSLSGSHDFGYRNFPQFDIQYKTPIQNWFDIKYHGFTTNNSIKLSNALFPLRGTSNYIIANGGVNAHFGYQEMNINFKTGLHWDFQSWMNFDAGIGYTTYSYFPMLNQQVLFDKWFYDEGLTKEVSQPETFFNLEIREEELGFIKLQTVPIGWSNGNTFSKLYLSSEGKWIWNKLSFHPRVQGGMSYWWNEREVSLANHFFLGGGKSVRGWGYRRLNSPLYDGKQEDIQPGGEIMLMSSIEFRYELLPEYLLFFFVDAGRVWDRILDQTDQNGDVISSGVHLHQLLPSFGLGLMAPTFVGNTAISGAWQLRNENELLYPPPRFSLHFSIIRPF
jgi:outer membrane protein assembly factor BamA